MQIDVLYYSEISAQECVYHLLSMPVSFCSRETIFFMTFPANQRFIMVKDNIILRELGNSTEIFQDGIIEHYVQRANDMEAFASKYDFLTNNAYNQRFKNSNNLIIIECLKEII